MPKSIEDRIGSEHLAIFLPGAYLLLSAALLHGARATRQGPQTLADSAVTRLSSDWSLAIGVVLAAYLIGQLVHAIPVNVADGLCGITFGWLARNPMVKLAYAEAFPYRPLMLRTMDALGGPLEQAGPIPASGHALDCHYGYWKAALSRHPEGPYALVREREARTRLYASLFWAGVGGLACSVIALVQMGNGFVDPERWQAAIATGLAISAGIAIVFGMHLRGVRAAEVDAVLLGYVAALLGEDGQQPTWGPRPAQRALVPLAKPKPD